MSTSVLIACINKRMERYPISYSSSLFFFLQQQQQMMMMRMSRIKPPTAAPIIAGVEAMFMDAAGLKTDMLGGGTTPGCAS